MNLRYVIMIVFVMILFTIFMALLAPAMQWRLLGLKTQYFKKIKIKKLSFMFRGIGGKHVFCGNVKEYGIIIPMFIIHIIGYIITLTSWILIPLFYFVFTFDLTTITFIMLGIFLTEALAFMITGSICDIIGKSRAKKANDE